MVPPWPQVLHLPVLGFQQPATKPSIVQLAATAFPYEAPCGHVQAVVPLTSLLHGFGWLGVTAFQVCALALLAANRPVERINSAKKSCFFK
jgi:hypothetical protein